MNKEVNVQLASMKRSAADKRKDMGSPCPIDSIAPDYPWGLTIHLEHDELKKLGMKDLPAVGTVFGLRAKVTVTCTRSSAVNGQDEENCVDLQITDMAVVPPGE